VLYEKLSQKKDVNEEENLLMEMMLQKDQEGGGVGEGGGSAGWWNKTGKKGFKRSFTLLGIVALLVFATMFLLKKEIQIEKTAVQLTKTTRSNKRQIAAVVGIELGLLGLNAFAAKRVIKITQAWRRARIGDVISKTKATIDVVTHPPPYMRPIIAPFQLFMRFSKPARVLGGNLKKHLQTRAARATLEWEKRKALFTNVLTNRVE
jgi:hypothetical protein